LLLGILLLILKNGVELHIGGGHGRRHGKEGKDEEGLHAGFLFDYFFPRFGVFALGV
jgi:hypothetical protein